MVESSYEPLVNGLIAVLIIGVVVIFFITAYSLLKGGISKTEIECKYFDIIPFICTEEDKLSLQQTPLTSSQQTQAKIDFLNNFKNTFETCKSNPENPCRCNIGFEKLFDDVTAYDLILIKKENDIIVSFGTESITLNNVPHILINRYSPIQQRQVFNPVNIDSNFLLGTDRIIIGKVDQSSALRGDRKYVKITFKNSQTNQEKVIVDFSFFQIQQGVEAFGISLEEASKFYASKIGISNRNGNLLLYLPQAIDMDNEIEGLFPIPEC